MIHLQRQMLLASGFFPKFLVIKLRKISTVLYVRGDKAAATTSILTPSLQHVDRLLEEQHMIRRSIEQRKLYFNLDAFTEVWMQMKELQLQRESLLDKRVLISNHIKELVSSKHGNAENTVMLNNLKEDGKKLREQLKRITTVWWDVEEKAITSALALPNIIHTNTPLENKVLYVFKEQPHFQFKPQSHIQHCDIKFVNHSPTAYYMKGNLARWEHKLVGYFCQKLVHHGYSLISSPDFVKSLVIDGCAWNFIDPKQVLALAAVQDHGTIESGQALHLVGGASLPAMVAYLTKNVIESPFPLRLCSLGRNYVPSSALSGLFGATQASCISLLSCLDSQPDNLFAECERIQVILIELLSHLDTHFRVVSQSATALQRWEQYKTTLEFYSPHLKQYIEVGSISIIGDFISRRLSIYSQKDYPGFIAVNALNISRLLGCYLENHQTFRGFTDVQLSLSPSLT